MTVDVAQDLADLYAAIMARVKGEKAQSIGHKGRTVGYEQTPLGEMVKMYRMLWTPSLGQSAGLPQIPIDLDASTASRGCYRLRLH